MPPRNRLQTLDAINASICACVRCPRLRSHCAQVAATKRRAYRDETYWGRPVPSFGDPEAKLLILGLAPAAHGANRTGRMFTGDSSGILLYRVLHKTGFASQPESVRRDDGLLLRGAYITASAHCAPPDNKPARAELAACRSFLEEELRLLTRVRAIVALGRIAFDTYLGILRDQGAIGSRASYAFGHGAVHCPLPTGPWLIASYHPSQQNTSTGKLTESMLVDVFRTAGELMNR